MSVTATYSPEDNKLRLYTSSRLDSDTYTRVKTAGFIYAPKQELFVAPMWTPQREDLLLELCGQIDDEDQSLVTRAEERSERFSQYSDNRAADAEHSRKAVALIADAIPFGQPILVGHHSERRARKDAQRIGDGMRHAVRMWETSTYWTERAAGAIRHAKYKERPDVRARRIKGVEADRRKAQKAIDEALFFIQAWEKDGLTLERARLITNREHIYREFPIAQYPRTEGGSPYEGSTSLWSALTGIITPEQARDIALGVHRRTIEYKTRWIAHFDNRLAYERAMLAEDGGTAADRTKPEKGGACRCWASPRGGYSIIQKVNKVSVTVLDTYGNGGKPFTRSIALDKLTELMSAADVQGKRKAGLLLESADGIGFVVTVPVPGPQPDAVPELGKTPGDPASRLRAAWTAQGVTLARQDALIEAVTVKAQPGARIGPFGIAG